MENDKVNVTIKWIVIVKLYGINPIKLLNKKKQNNTKINGKYFSPFIFKLSNNKMEQQFYKYFQLKLAKCFKY